MLRFFVFEVGVKREVVNFLLKNLDKNLWQYILTVILRLLGDLFC